MDWSTFTDTKDLHLVLQKKGKKVRAICCQAEPYVSKTNKNLSP